MSERRVKVVAVGRYWRCLMCLLVCWIIIVLHSTTAAEIRQSKITSSCFKSHFSPPKCIDHPDGYGCDCGPGFHWNTDLCMSAAVDSRLEFQEQTPLRYTLLLGRAFPRLKEFTIAFWIKVPNPLLNGTILSYQQGSWDNLLLMRSGPTLAFQIWNKSIDSELQFQGHRWYHVVWTWDSEDGRWHLFVNGREKRKGSTGGSKPIPLGGEFVLGQASRETFKFVEKYAFVGDLAHLHIWDFVMTSEEVNYIKELCKLMYCGNAVQWTEFRKGTRGAMRMRWPSGVIVGQCYSEEEVGVTCNKYCSDIIGAQCNEEIIENIVWSRTPALNNISIPCPGDALIDEKTWNKSGIHKVSEGCECLFVSEAYIAAYGTRSCNRTDENEGEWGQANIDDCISTSLKQLKYKFQHNLLSNFIEVSTLLDLGSELMNHTKTNTYINPVDVATVIDMLAMLVNTQARVINLRTIRWTDTRVSYARAKKDFPRLDETEEFMTIISDIVNNLLNEKHDLGWSVTRPPGDEGDNLMKVIETFGNVLAQSMENHVNDGSIGGRIGFEQAYMATAREEIEVSVEAQWVQIFQGSKFPSWQDKQHGIYPSLGEIELSKSLMSAANYSDLPAFIKVTSVRLKDMAEKLPNHDVRSTGIKAKEDNVNTPIIAMFIHAGDVDFTSNLSVPVIYRLPYLNTFNISNPECVRLVHGTILGGRIKRWRWTRDGCELREDTGYEGVCACSVSGIFAIITDMYDVNWNKGEVRHILMNFASYVGCCSSAVLCLATCLLHIYYRTSSSTSALHKNLAISVVLGQLVFMIGIERYDSPSLCQVFAVALHYFFLANFSWLMNEAFNLYIVITYSSHAHGQQNDSGSLVRYYILGWIIPAILVGAFVGSQGDGYYSRKMCWVAWDNLWLFIGPAVGIIAVTIMVLIFTAKEHNENSYTKSEKSNKFILLLMKALWTQIILITVVWSFAFISLKMSDKILKYLFGLFNFLQGAFFLVFYLLLNEEIRDIFKSKKKKKTLLTHGYDDTDDRSLDSQMSTHLVEKDRLETLALDPRPRRRKDIAARRKRRRKQDSTEIDEEDRNASDCEMITSV